MDQATGEVNTIFRGGNIWGNNNLPPSPPHTLGITGGNAVTMTQQATAFMSGGNAPTSGTSSQNLHKELMGGTPMLQNTGAGGNIMGGTTGVTAAPQE